MSTRYTRPTLFDGIAPPPRGRGHRIRVKQQWEERGISAAESAADLVRGVMIARLDKKLDEFVAWFVDEYGFTGDEAVKVFQWVQTALFPESFDVDLDVEKAKAEEAKGLLPRGGGGRMTAQHLEHFAALLREQGRR